MTFPQQYKMQQLRPPAEQQVQVSRDESLVFVHVQQGDISDVLEFTPERAEQLSVQLAAAARLARRVKKV